MTKWGMGKSTQRKSTITELSKRFGYVCWYCGQSLRGMNIHVDHMVPRCRGGADKLDNLALVCEFCNMAKRDHDLQVFLEWVDGLKRINWCPVAERWNNCPYPETPDAPRDQDFCPLPRITGLYVDAGALDDVGGHK